MVTKSIIKGSLLFFTISSVILLESCGNNTNDKTDSDSSAATSTETNSKPGELKPANPKPDWGKDLTDPMTVVIEKLKSYNAPPLVSLSAQDARKQPSPADAAMAVMTEHNLPMPPNNVDTTGKDIPVQGGTIHLRIY